MWIQLMVITPLGFPRGVAERSESFKIMIAGGNHSKIKKLSDGTSEPAGLTDEGVAIAQKFENSTLNGKDQNKCHSSGCIH